MGKLCSGVEQINALSNIFKLCLRDTDFHRALSKAQWSLDDTKRVLAQYGFVEINEPVTDSVAFIDREVLADIPKLLSQLNLEQIIA